MELSTHRQNQVSAPHHEKLPLYSHSQVAERLIYPYGLYAFNGFWYCACFDYKRQQHVSLRADRVLSLERVEVEGPGTPSKMSLREWFQGSDPDEGLLFALHIVITKRGMKNASSSALMQEATLDEDGNGMIKKMVATKDLAFYAGLLLPLGRDVIITSPAELIEVIKQRAREILEHYA